MNIGIICYPTYGGSGVVATELGKALGQEGHKVHFISYDQPARLDFFSENVYYHEVSVSKYPLFRYPPYEIALASKIVDIVQFANLEMLHVHYAIPHAAAALMARQILEQKGIYIPVITTLHGTDITLVGKDPTYEPVVSYSINQSDGVTSVSESLKQDTYSHFDVVRDIEVIPNFIDFGRFSKKPREHFKKAIAPNDEYIVVHTSNFRKVKRIEDVIAIFDRIRKQVPARLLLVGDGPERFNMEKVCREFELNDAVTFLGKQDAVEEILSVGDLFLLPSQTESFGLAALEAMACEVPVISSNSGGLPEVNVDGFSGFTSDVGDVESMAENALRILGPELETFKKQALAQAQKFDIKYILPMYENYYHKVIDGCRVKSSGKNSKG
jgi:glycosyltransferase involved in cell wall biosynthesis